MSSPKPEKLKPWAVASSKIWSSRGSKPRAKSRRRIPSRKYTKGIDCSGFGSSSTTSSSNKSASGRTLMVNSGTTFSASLKAWVNSSIIRRKMALLGA
jgi:hypothetical protein